MDLVLLKEDLTRPLPFYLALEEWLAVKHADRDFFFLWQVAPTVIIGRNQMAEKEVDMEYCRVNGIDVVRRRSGGGAVFADMNNVMLSYITSSVNVETTFSTYTSAVAASLRLLGLDASDNSRNDVLIADRKVSGNSYYHLPGRSIVHGTMLYDCDPCVMQRALTPPAVKLQSHSVDSVRSRVTTIREHLPGLGMDDFKRHLESTVPDGGDVMTLTPDDIAEVEALSQRYRASGWLQGRKLRGTVEHTGRIDGVGTLTVNLNVKGGRIEDFALYGDYMEPVDAGALIAGTLDGVMYERDEIMDALRTVDFEKILPGLSAGQLTQMMI